MKSNYYQTPWTAVDVMKRNLAILRLRLAHAISSYKCPVVLVLLVRPQCRITKQSLTAAPRERAIWSALHFPTASLLVQLSKHNPEEGFRLDFPYFKEVSAPFTRHPSDFALLAS